MRASFSPASSPYLEQRDLPYIIMARLTPVLRRVGPGIDVADSMFTLPSWGGQTRRMVCLRQALRERPQAAGRRLVDCPGSTYQLMVTSVP